MNTILRNNTTQIPFQIYYVIPLLQRLPQQYPVTNPTTRAATAPAETVMINVSNEKTIAEATVSGPPSVVLPLFVALG